MSAELSLIYGSIADNPASGATYTSSKAEHSSNTYYVFFSKRMISEQEQAIG